jgi:hypothetical protein
MNLVFSRRLGRSLAALALVGAAIVAPRLANAGTIEFSIGNESAPTNGITGGTGSFDVLITDSGTDTIGQFGMDIFLNSGASSVAFTTATLITTSPYVFVGNSGQQTASGPAGQPFVDSNEASNSDLTNSGTVTLSGALQALINVSYVVPAGTAAGDYAITFNQDDPTTDPFADYTSTTNTSPIDTSPGLAPAGAIVVTTPEPSSIALLVLGAIGLFGFRRLRRRA